MTVYNPYVYQALALRRGLLLYASTGRKPNTAWTPGAMLRTAGRITGKTYSRRQYAQAATDLHEWVQSQMKEQSHELS